MKYCGECEDFEAEDMDGFGYCIKFDKDKKCSALCEENEENDILNNCKNFGSVICGISEGADMYDRDYCWRCQ